MNLPKLSAGHFVDNPASGAVLRKLGFRPTGKVAQRYSLARGGEAACALFEEGDADADAVVTPMRSRIGVDEDFRRSEEHTSELQSLMRISYAVFCLKKKSEK